jgi:hypothetical protein
MLAIHISRKTLKYAQLVNFKGTPFVESLGKMAVKEGLRTPDTTSAEVIRGLSEQISEIRNSAEFPDTSTHLVIDSDWFPMLVHEVDEVLSKSDIDKYLEWRIREMLESSGEHYRLLHQELSSTDKTRHKYLSIGIPQTFDIWVNKVTEPSDLEVKNVTLDIQALGDLLARADLLDLEGGIQVILENKAGSVTCYIYKGKDYEGHFQATMDGDRKLTLSYTRGDSKLINSILSAIEAALRGTQDPDTVITNLFYFTSTGDDSLLNNLQLFDTSCRPLNLVEHFNFRDPEYANIDEYAIVLGALSVEIAGGFDEA